MAPLQRQNININFAQGLNTKSDPWQLPPGQFLSLKNSVFNKTGQLTKRNGFGFLPPLPSGVTANSLSLHNDNLIAFGSSLYSLSQDTNQWLTKGPIQPLSLSVEPLVRRSTSQTSVDVAVAANGLACSTWLDADGSSYYHVSDSSTGEILLSSTALPATAINSRVFVFGAYFLVTFLATVAAAPHLQYIAVPFTALTSPTAATDLSTNVSSIAGGYDGVVLNTSFYIAWNGNDMGGATRVLKMISSFTKSAEVVVSAHAGTYISVASDTSIPTGSSVPRNRIWITYYSVSDTTVRTRPYDVNLAATAATTSLASVSAGVKNLTSAAGRQSSSILSSVRIFIEVINTYPSGVSSNYIQTTGKIEGSSTLSGAIIQRGVSLASKAYYDPSTAYEYFVAQYAGGNSTGTSSYEPTYFLMQSKTITTGNMVAKLAQSNGGGYYQTQVLPQINVNDSILQTGYLYQDLVTSVNKIATNSSGSPTPAAGIYAQTGINLAFFSLDPEIISTAEIAGSTHFSGGLLWQYTGGTPVEHGFEIYPEDFTATWSPGATPTANLSSGNLSITSLSTTVGVLAGMNITGTDIPAGTTVLSVNTGANSLVMSQAATGTHVGETVTISGSLPAKPGGGSNTNAYFYAVTYEWTDSAGNIHRSAPSVPVAVTTSGSGSAGAVSLVIPTLRLTYKGSVRIVVYRWALDQQVFYQVWSPALNPLPNSKTSDYVTYGDLVPSSSIVGNPVLYTTGGVVENIAAPATSVISLFKSRLMLLDAEDPNLLFYSKQVIENTPVEMSDLFTQYLAPTTGAQGSTGKNKCAFPMDDKFVLFKQNAIYYITGTGPDNTGANNDFSEPVFITSTVGSSNQNSLVLTPQGIMFQSNKGIWLLGRDLSTNYIGAPVEAYNSATVLSAVCVPDTNQVRFTLDDGNILMYDYYYNQWSTFVGLSNISSVIYQNSHTLLDTYGRLFQETPSTYLDGSSPVLMSFTTSWLSLAGIQGFERAYFFYLLGQYLSPHKLQLGIAHDYDPTPTQNLIITPDNYAPPYGAASGPYGSGVYGGPSQVEQWRIFLQRQKCQSFQLTLTELFDPSYGTVAGAGFTLSGINVVAGIKKGYTTLRPSRSAG